MLSSQQKRQIISIIKSPEWGVLEIVRNELIDKIKAEPRLMETEWETLKNAGLIEGQISGINQYFQALFDYAKDV